VVLKLIYGGLMPKIWTLGGPSKRTQFTYKGDVKTDVVLQFTGRPRISASFFQDILQRFKGITILGGFSMTDPTSGGFGEWIQNNCAKLNSVSLTPRHASFIAAILVNEGYITSSLKGNAVYLHFK